MLLFTFLKWQSSFSQRLPAKLFKCKAGCIARFITYFMKGKLNKSIDGVMSAIEAGIITSTTKARLEELEAKAEQLKIDISDSELPVPDVDRDFIVYWLTKFRSGSLGDEEAQREFVDSLIFAVRVWNDRAEVVLNYSGDERIIDVLFGGAAETGGGSSKGQNSEEIRC